jgi:hypothetical protein
MTLQYVVLACNPIIILGIYSVGESDFMLVANVLAISNFESVITSETTPGISSGRLRSLELIGNLWVIHRFLRNGCQTVITEEPLTTKAALNKRVCCFQVRYRASCSSHFEVST